MIKKCKIKVSSLKLLLHETNCVLRRHCLRSSKKEKTRFALKSSSNYFNWKIWIWRGNQYIDVCSFFIKLILLITSFNYRLFSAPKYESAHLHFRRDTPSYCRATCVVLPLQTVPSPLASTERTKRCFTPRIRFGRIRGRETRTNIDRFQKMFKPYKGL